MKASGRAGMHGEDPGARRCGRRRFLTGAGAAAISALSLGCVGRRTPAPVSPPPVTGRGRVEARPSPWFTRLEGGRVQCLLCPHRCTLAEGERARCRARDNRRGVGHTLVFGNPALVQEDPIERKPFFHLLPGSRTLSIATAGCNLRCHFCEAWDMALVNPEEIHAYDMPPETVIAHAQASGVRAIGYGFGEPVAFYEYMAAVAALARPAGLANLLHTAGYIEPVPLKQLCAHLDAANVDLKSFDPGFYREVVGGELQPVLDSLRLLRAEGIHLEITNLVIPTLNDDMAGIGRMCRWIVQELGPEVPLHFARFYPLYKLSALPRTPVSTLEEARRTALAAGLQFVYIARVPGHEGEHTFCPACRRLVVRRIGFIVGEMHLDRGACRFCGAAIPGRWA